MRIALRLAAVYILWCVALYLFQDFLVFPSHMAHGPASRMPMDGAVIFSHDVGDGDEVVAWFLPAPDCDADRPAPVVIYFHGNAELIAGQQHVVFRYHQLGWSVLLPEYRGYGGSGGSPSQFALRADAVRFHDTLVSRNDVDASRIVFHGHSLGGAVAADLAAYRKPAALILQSTFTSMPAMAHRFLVPGFIARHPFRTDRVVESLDVPILVFHGRHDRLIPVRHGRRLGALAANCKYVEYECGHDDLPDLETADAYWHEIGALLSRLAP